MMEAVIFWIVMLYLLSLVVEFISAGGDSGKYQADGVGGETAKRSLPSFRKFKILRRRIFREKFEEKLLT